MVVKTIAFLTMGVSTKGDKLKVSNEDAALRNIFSYEAEKYYRNIAR